MEALKVSYDCKGMKVSNTEEYRSYGHGTRAIKGIDVVLVRAQSVHTFYKQAERVAEKARAAASEFKEEMESEAKSEGCWLAVIKGKVEETSEGPLFVPDSIDLNPSQDLDKVPFGC